MSIDRIAAERMHERLGLRDPFVPPPSSPLAWRERPITQWGSDGDDAMLRFLYRALRPRRHLEFGTWQGEGTLRCLRECDATVWTLNLREGETHGDNLWRYYTDQPNADAPTASRVAGAESSKPRHFRSSIASAGASEDSSPSHPAGDGGVAQPARDAGIPADAATRVTRTGKTIYQTDAHGFIGRHVHAAGLGHRVCQMFCDSTRWDTSNYPAGFFDTALIDGGHTPPVVTSDTRKALPLVRSGGVILWHDYCPLPEVIEACESVRGVVQAIDALREELASPLRDLFWIEPSWLLVGVRR